MTVTSLLKHRVVNNGAWFTLMQAANILIPIATLPYVTRTLGPSPYGFFATALNLVGYFQVLVEYGFNLTGSRKVALAESDELSQVVSAVMSAKFVLCGMSLVLIAATAALAPLDESVGMCLLALFGVIAGEGIRQTWVFQGLQDMRAVTIGVILARLFAAGLVFMFVSGPGDVYVYCLLYGLSHLLAALVSAVMVRVRLSVRIVPQFGHNIIRELKSGWPLFTASAMAVLFSAIGVTVLGLTSSSAEVGRFAAVQKIPSILVLLYAPIGMALFPHVSSRHRLSFTRGTAAVRRSAALVLPFVGAIAVVLIVMRAKIVELTIGAEYVGGAGLLIPLSVWMFLSIANNLLGVQVLVASGRSVEYSAALRVATAIMIGLCVVLGPSLGAIGVALSTMSAEFCLMALLARAVLRAAGEHRTL